MGLSVFAGCPRYDPSEQGRENRIRIYQDTELLREARERGDPRHAQEVARDWLHHVYSDLNERIPVDWEPRIEIAREDQAYTGDGHYWPAAVTRQGRGEEVDSHLLLMADGSSGSHAQLSAPDSGPPSNGSVVGNAVELLDLPVGEVPERFRIGTVRKDNLGSYYFETVNNGYWTALGAIHETGHNNGLVHADGVIRRLGETEEGDVLISPMIGGHIGLSGGRNSEGRELDRVEEGDEVYSEPVFSWAAARKVEEWFEAEE